MKMNINDLRKIAKANPDNAIKLELKDDNNKISREIYSELFPFYNEKTFSGDVIFTWRSPSLVKDGDYIGRRDLKVDNNHFIGNIFPNFITNHKYSLNLNRNGSMGDFPHDYIDIYLMHVAKYAFNDGSKFVKENIKEYYPLKRAVEDSRNLQFFKEQFGTFESYLEKNYLVEVWEQIKIKCFSDMEFEEFKKVSLELIEKRGRIMIDEIKKK